MRDHQHRFSPHKRFEGLLNLVFIFRIGKGGRLVQNDDGRVLQNGSCQRDSLALAAREIDALRADHRVQSLRQLFQDIPTLGGQGRLHHLFSGSLRARRADVFQNALLKEPGILKNKSHLPHQRLRVHFPHIHAAHRHAPCRHIPETGNQAARRGLSAAGRPYQRHRASRADGEAHVRKGGTRRARVGEGNVFKGHLCTLRLLWPQSLRQRLLLQDFFQLSHGLVRLHHRLAHVHDPVDHGSAGRSEQGIENEIDQHPFHIPAGGQQQGRRDQKDKGSVDTGQKPRLPAPAAHGVVAGQPAVGLDRRVKRPEGVHGLLEHLHHRNAPDVFHRLRAHFFNLLLIPVEEARVFPAHHHAHADHRKHHGEQTQKPHPPVEQKQHHDSRHRRENGRRQIGQLVGQQILRQPRVVVDELSQPPGLVSGEKSQREVHHMGHSSPPDVPRRPEGGDVGTHQGREIKDNVGGREDHGHPAPFHQAA